ncbi:hypothetical protein AB9K26_13905 [Psychroserpens sp. XS_ASV72]|uniref:hypothetical protein n=1 Tax=Psychroserpens sp. XS_ASV72 TaxID=3241293 RepID=UPI003511C9DF
MKIYIAFLCVAFLSLSCSKDNNEEIIPVNENSSQTSARLPECPPNSHAVLHYQFSSFRFKRPKYDCERGFWFCFTDPEWQVHCVDNYNGAVVKTISLSNVDQIEERTTVAGLINKGDKIVDFYFPIELVGLDGNTLEDFAIFNVDDDENIYITNGVTLIPGDYPSRVEGSEIIVSVNFQ